MGYLNRWSFFIALILIAANFLEGVGGHIRNR